MKISDHKGCAPCGQTLDTFRPGNCIRRVHVPGVSAVGVGSLYMVVTAGYDYPVAICLSDGNYTLVGRFVLEPTAKVVVE